MLLITKRHAVVERCSDVAGVAVPYIDRWIPDAVMGSQVLIVDGRALTRREGLLLRAYSRLPERQPIILIDDGSLSRAELALIAVEYVIAEQDITLLTHALGMTVTTARLRRCGHGLAARFAHAPRLKRAIMILFSGNRDLCRIKALAAAANVPERTLRAQWRTVVGSSVRLSDIARGVRMALVDDSKRASDALAGVESECAGIADSLPLFVVDVE